MSRPMTRKQDDPGVPEALPRTLVRLRDRLGVETIDRLWIFPPVRRGRREQGLVAVSTFQQGEERRSMITVTYNAEHTGKGITVEPAFTMEGAAPAETFPPVMEGVVRRSGEGAEGPREILIDGTPSRFEELMEEYDDVFIEAVGP
ncbi:MAG: hypothetical protein ACPHQP_00380 [Longimicrobiales bacterium]